MIDTGKTPTKQVPSVPPIPALNHSPALPLSSSSSATPEDQKVDIVYKSQPPMRRPTQQEEEQEELILRALKEIENADLDGNDPSLALPLSQPSLSSPI